MFGKLKELILKKENSWSESDFINRPITYAILLKTKSELKNELFLLNYKDQIDFAINNIVMDLLKTAMKKSSIGDVSLKIATPLPNERIPREAFFILAFGFLISAYIILWLKNEGENVDINKVFLVLTTTLFLFQSEEVKLNYYEQACDIYKKILTSELTNVDEWRKSLSDLLLVYLQQINTKNKKFKNIDFPSLFGSLLNTILNSVEYS